MAWSDTMKSATAIERSRGFFSLGIALVVLALSGSFAVFAAKKHGEQPHPAASETRPAGQAAGPNDPQTGGDTGERSNDPLAAPKA
jgi:hypothetical protein